MPEASALEAVPREVIGHANRRLAAEHQVPAVVYGAGRDATPIAVDRHDFENFLAHHGHTGLVALKIEGEGKPVNVVIRDIQYSAVKGGVLHIDFLAVRMDETIQSTVPLHLVSDPAGVREGGVLTVNVHELNVEALPSDLPDVIEYDVAELNIGDSVRIGDLTVPAAVKLLDDPEQIVASVQGARIEVEEVAAEEAVEPEVIGENAEEE